ncbi:uncharacterized protein [Chelonus insularis]|uniref:uncharacterized protein n=1 Tax=Chelonus insularis TaxID=460826 RepID=UPI0015890F07|nr:uncharacterized protein LOC118074990 [Chelonus insularis]
MDPLNKEVKEIEQKKNWEPLKQCAKRFYEIPFFVKNHRHRADTFIWIIACIVSWYSFGTSTMTTINDFRTRKTAIMMDTNYLDWKIDFPALHLCFSFTLKAKDYAIGITRTSPQKTGTLSRLSHWVKLGYDNSMKYPMSSQEFINLRESLIPECSDIFGVCKWNDEPIDCCKIFFPLHSNLGGCLSFNSIHAGKPTDPNLQEFFMSHHQPSAKFTLFLNKTSFWLSSRSFLAALLTDPLEYPTQTTGHNNYLSAQWNHPKSKIWDITQLPTYNNGEAISAMINQRKCRLTNETEGLFFSKYYSYPGCIMEAQMAKFYERCGCVGHVFPASNKYRTCNQTELSYCSNGLMDELVDIDDNICLPSCEETKIKLFENNIKTDIPEWASSQLEFNMLPGPTIRYYRYTLVSLLDVIIKVASTLGFFIGASVFTFVKILCWLLFRNSHEKYY